MLKKRQVVMLPTNEKAEGRVLLLRNNILTYQKEYFTKIYLEKTRTKSFYLYILSDEEIKEGDWMYRKGAEPITIKQAEKGTTSPRLSSLGWLKIIATTDNSLTFLKKARPDHSDPVSWYYPQPSQSFLEVFVREYNKGNVIKEVMVEYETIINQETQLGNKDNLPLTKEAIKINFKDNTITIKRVKENWSREEVKSIILDFADFNGSFKRDGVDWIDKWIEQNL